MAELHKPGLAPREVFEQTLFYFPIPTFDLVLEHKNGIILVKRKIAPYKDVWALPGLRALKGVSREDRLAQIAIQEVEVTIDPKARKWLGEYQRQFIGEENNREDISTCYLIPIADEQEVILNNEHFSEYRFCKPNESIPEPIGDMYQYYLEEYMKLKTR